MSNNKIRQKFKCTKEFRDLAIEISRMAGFTHFKKGKVYTRKKGFSHLLNEITEQGEFTIEGNYKSTNELLNRHIANHNNNLAQLVRTVGSEVFQTGDGKTYSLNQYIREYQSASEIAYQFIEHISNLPSSKEKTKLEIFTDLKKASENNTHEVWFTFVVSEKTLEILQRFGNIREATADHICKSWVNIKNFNLSERDKIKLDKFVESFKLFNTLVAEINKLNSESKRVNPKAVANKLKELKTQYETVGN